jgi:hypothetical protein
MMIHSPPIGVLCIVLWRQGGNVVTFQVMKGLILLILVCCWQQTMSDTVKKLWGGGDPDAPNPESGLTARDVYNIQDSWAPIYADAGNIGLKLFLG